MVCPMCGAPKSESHAIDSRPVARRNAVRRRRECLRCQHRFSTLEVIVPDYKQRLPADLEGEPEPLDDMGYLLRRAAQYLDMARLLVREQAEKGQQKVTLALPAPVVQPRAKPDEEFGDVCGDVV